MFRPLALALCLALPATTAAAQEDPVTVRMAVMKAIAGNLKVIGDMAKGTTEFDAEKANDALSRMAMRAGQVPAVFESNVTNDESEALPAIWENWDDFVAKSNVLETAAASASVSSAEDLGLAIRAVGGTCRDCHQTYRE